jgi:hypothetical protein
MRSKGLVRGARLGWLLARGMTLATEEVAELTGLSNRRADALMGRLLGKLPVERTPEGHWRGIKYAEVDCLSDQTCVDVM